MVAHNNIFSNNHNQKYQSTIQIKLTAKLRGLIKSA